MVNRRNIETDAQIEEQVIFNQQNMGIGSAVGQRWITTGPPKKKARFRNNKIEADKVYSLARKSTQVLFQTHTVFPFDFFPDTLTITANKLDVVNSTFFASHETTSIPLRDIANIEIQTAPFFATLRIINIRYPMHPLILRYLKKDDAFRAKNIIDGLLVAMSQGADISAIEPKQFLEEIERVGESAING